MATGALRKIAAQGIRVFSQRNIALQPRKTCCRKIHVSAAAWQKYFSEKHEWVEVPEGSKEATVGITDYAQAALGDVVFVQLPELKDCIEADGEVGVLESVKAASDIYSPLSGEVIAINEDVVNNPSLINTSPNDEGWLYKMTVTNSDELDCLMDEAGYDKFLKTL